MCKIHAGGLTACFFLFFLSSLSGQGTDTFPKLQPSRVQNVSRDIPSVAGCFKNVISGKDGRVWLNPCYNENFLYDLHLVQFDGYDLFPVLLKDTFASKPFSSVMCGMTPEGEIFGYSENLSVNYLFLINPYEQQIRLYDFGAPPSAKGRIRNVCYSKNGGLIVLTQSERHLRLFEFSGDTARQIVQVDREDYQVPVFVESVKKLPLVETAQGIWFMDDYLPLYRYDPATAKVNKWDLADFLPSAKKTGKPSGTNLFWENKLLYHRGQLTVLLPWFDQKLFQMDTADGQIRLISDFPSSWSATYITSDRQGNLLFTFEEEQKIRRAVLQDTSGRRFDYSALLENDAWYFYDIIADDFFRHVFVVWENNLISSGVRELKGIHVFPFHRMRGIPGAFNDRDFVFYDNKSQVQVINTDGIRTAKEVSRKTGGNCLLDLIPLSTNLLRSMYDDASGKLWTHQSDNLIQYNPQNSVCTAYPTGGLFITRFSFMGEHTIAFLSTLGTLHLFDIPTATTAPVPVEAATPGFTYDIRATPDSIIWVPTSQGLWRVDCKSGQSDVLGFSEAFNDHRFQAIDIDESGQIWLGSAMGGLQIYDPSSGTVKVVDLSQGLSGNTVWSIVSDDEGDKWVGTNDGLNLVSPTGEVLTNIMQKDGLPSNNFLLFGAKRSNSGLLFFATDKGMALIEPDSLKSNLRPKIPGPVYLTALSYYSADRQMEITKTTGLDRLPVVRLPASRRYLKLRFALPSYISPQENRFAYRLEGQDTDWNYLGTRQELNLQNLPAGSYKLLIRGSDYRRNWSDQPLVIELFVQEYFYRNTWFYLLITLTLSGIAAIWLWRQRQENKHLETEVLKRTQRIQEDKQVIEEQVGALQEKNQEIIRAQQEMLVQEKLASLGQLTAGIAHEIKNPLNFVNNFAEGSLEIINELKENLSRQKNSLSPDLYAQIQDYLEEIGQNAVDIEANGRKIDRIVRGMMDHARQTSEGRRSADLHELLEEALHLAYHSYRAKDSSFVCDLHKEYDPQVQEVAVFSQSLSRVFLNILDNAYFEVNKKRKELGDGFRPMVRLKTLRHQDGVEIRMADNGSGISDSIRQEIFNPFFTTKPTGEGNTGLGLSLSYDIIVKEHGGTFEVDSQPGTSTEFIIWIPDHS